MRILGVLDIQHGLAVRGMRGDRARYQPVSIAGVRVDRPIELARWYREHYGLTDLYLADLDAIAGQPPACERYRELMAEGFALAVDAGIRSAPDADRIFAEVPNVELILGTETLPSPDVLREIIRRHPGEPIRVSVDLRAGEPIVCGDHWEASSAEALIDQLIGMGAKSLLILDLSRVGSGDGLGSDDLVQHTLTQRPNASVWVGGGLRHDADLTHWRTQGVSGILVASALIEGRLDRDLVRSLVGRHDS